MWRFTPIWRTGLTQPVCIVIIANMPSLLYLEVKVHRNKNSNRVYSYIYFTSYLSDCQCICCVQMLHFVASRCLFP